MAELLVNIVDKVNADPYLDVQCHKRGDVINVMPDGFGWGKDELNNPNFRIVKIPGVTVTQASAFLGLELPEDPLHPSKMLQLRAFKLDIDALPDPLGQMADGRRKNPLHKINMSVAELSAFKIAKPRRQDPNVMG